MGGGARQVFKHCWDARVAASDVLAATNVQGGSLQLSEVQGCEIMMIQSSSFVLMKCDTQLIVVTSMHTHVRNLLEHSLSSSELASEVHCNSLYCQRSSHCHIVALGFKQSLCRGSRIMMDS